MDSRRGFILFFLLFFLLTAPGPHPPSPWSEREHERQISEERRALSLLNSSSYGDFDTQAGRYLPLVGLTQEDGYAWGLLPTIQDKARKHLRIVLQNLGIQTPNSHELQPDTPISDLNIANLSLPVYRNVTGKIRGDWVRSKETERISPPNLNFTSIAAKHDFFTRDFGHNVTADQGRLVLNLHEEEDGAMSMEGNSIREIKADMIVHSDQSLGESWLVSLFGLHFPALGGIVLSTTSEKFAGLSSLPHLALSKDTFELSRQLLNRSLSEALLEKQNHPANFLPWSSLPHGSNSAAFPVPNCEYVVYLQQHPTTVHGEAIVDPILELIEEELRFPTGAPIPKPPPMVMSAVIFSPDCGFVLETKESPAYPPTDNLYLVGLKQEEYRKYAARFITIIAGVLASQIMMLMRQMKESSTPSTRSRVSFYTIAMMSMGDALLICYILLELFSETSFLLLTATSFLAFFGVSFLGMKFQIEIWLVQAPERREREQQSANAQPPSDTPTDLPLPVSARRPDDTGATPVVLPPDQDEPDATPANPTQTQEGNDTGPNAGAMYSRFYFILFGILFFSSWSLFWPSEVRSIYAKALSFVYLSFWTPQIYRNIMRNCRKALRWDFVVGESLLRLFPFVYFYLAPRNVLLIQSDLLTTFSLVAWVWIQVWALVSQDILGPRFFVPKSWVPPAYDYHPVLRNASTSGSGEDLEAGGTLLVTSLRAEQREVVSPNARDGDKEASNDQRKIFDCAICMQDIEVPVLPAPGSGTITGTNMATNLLNRRAYMVTPCYHIFHSQCLETWMRLRLQCPICRETIPPI